MTERPPLRGRPTDVGMGLFALLFVPWFFVFAPVARLVHAAGHLLGGEAGGASAIGLWLPMFGTDLALLNYPTPIWSGTAASLAFFAGGAAASLATAALVGFLWPQSFSLASRLLPLQAAACLVAFGVARPLSVHEPRGETGLLAERLGIPPAGLVLGALALGAVAVVLFTLRALTVASVISDVRTSGRRLAFALGFWTVPAAVFEVMALLFGRPSTFEMVVGFGLAILPAVAAATMPRPLFYQRMDGEGAVPAAALGAVAAVALWGAWAVLFAGFAPPSAKGILWGTPGSFHNVRPETPSRPLGAVLKGIGIG